MNPAPSIDVCARLASLLVLVLVSACNRVEFAPTTASARPNVLLVSIDTLRADHVGAYGAESARTPTLDRLSAEGVRFEAAFSPAPITLPSHSTLLTGLDPYRHGVRHNEIHRLEDEIVTIAERFSEAGYQTGAAVGSLVLGTASGLNQGFDHYDDALPKSGDHSTAQRRAAVVNAAAIEWLDRTNDAPFFLFVHYYDPHYPLAAPASFADIAASPYDAEISYTDAMLGELLQDLEARGQLANTIIAVSSDHGEGLGEHDELTHSHAIYDATQHIPLILRGPGLPAGRIVPEITRLADVAPTLLSLTGIEVDEDIDGSSLQPLWQGNPTEERVAYVESLAPQLDHGWSPLHGIRTREHLYIRSPQPELYAGNTQGQTNNLLLKRSEEFEAAVARYENMLDERLAHDSVAQRESIDPATLAQLQALGYAITDEPVQETNLDSKIGRKSMKLYHAGDRLYGAGRFAEAVVQYREMLAISPDSPEAWFSLGAAYIGLGDAEQAHQASLEAVERRPLRAAAWLQLGITEMMLGQPARGEHAFREAARLQPEAPGAHFRLLRSLVQRGAIPEALDYDRTFAALPSVGVTTLRRLADFWESTKQTEQALAAYQRVLRVEPTSERDHMHAAIALIRLGREAEAKAHLEKAGGVASQSRAQAALSAAYRAAAERSTSATHSADL